VIFKGNYSQQSNDTLVHNIKKYVILVHSFLSSVTEDKKPKYDPNKYILLVWLSIFYIYSYNAFNLSKKIIFYISYHNKIYLVILNQFICQMIEEILLCNTHDSITKNYNQIQFSGSKIDIKNPLLKINSFSGSKIMWQDVVIGRACRRWLPQILTREF
jgi:hypothetical protein